MERDQAVDIAVKFAKQFPGLGVDATQVSGPEWCLRLSLRSGVEVRAFTRESARLLWQNVPLLEGLKGG